MALVSRSATQASQRYLIPKTLSHSGGIITASFETNTTVGGSYQVTLTGLTANTRYFLYIRHSGITPSLFFATTTPSLYRVLFPDAVLVGAFYSDGMSPVAFGSFVNIEGTPVTDWISYQPVWSSTGTPPTLGNGTLTGKFKLVGDSQEVHFELNGGTTTSAGTGGYTFTVPLTIDPAKMAVANPTSTILSLVNSQYGNQRVQVCVYGGTTFVYMFVMTDAGGTGNIDFGGQITATSPTTFGNGHKLGTMFKVPVAGITNVSLKDL
jgi:hypothetical protein